jgi:transposase
MQVLIGVDPHKATNVVAVLSEHGELLERASFCTNRSGLRSLMCWVKRFPERRWAVESANGLGYQIARHLIASGEKVVDVPAKLSTRIRVLSVGNERKNDQLDALYVALAAWHSDRLSEVNEEGYVARGGIRRYLENALRKTRRPCTGAHPHPEPPPPLAQGSPAWRGFH